MQEMEDKLIPRIVQYDLRHPTGSTKKGQDDAQIIYVVQLINE